MSTRLSENFCRTFDLTTRIPASIIEKAIQTGQLKTFDVSNRTAEDLISSESPPITQALILKIENLLSQRSSASPTIPLRICVPFLGSSAWGDLRSQVLHFPFFLLSAHADDHSPLGHLAVPA